MFKKISLALLLAAHSALAVDTVIPNDRVKIGKNTAADKAIILNTGAGNANPQLKWNSSTSKMQFTNDGNIFVDLGSGSGGGGSKNYVNNGDFEFGTTTGYSLFHTTLTSGRPSGSILSGASSVTNFAIASSFPLSGKYSLTVTANATSTSGQGFISDAFTIDNSDRNRILAFKFNYQVTSGLSNINLTGTANNTFAVFLYDVTNSAWIQPSGSYNLVQGVGVGQSTGTFQTSNTGSQYRLAVVGLGTMGTGPFTMLFDDFSVGPQITANGAAISNTRPYPMIITGSNTNPTLGATSINEARWRQIGDSAEIYLTLNQTSAGTAGSGYYLYSLPPGLSVDLNKVSANASPAAASNVGSASANFVGNDYTGFVKVYDATHLALAFVSQNNGFAIYQSDTNGMYGASPITVSFKAVVPIAGWSSNTVMSADTDTRVVSFTGMSIGNQSLTANVTDIMFYAYPGGDRTGSWFTDHFICPTAGDYFIANQTSSQNNSTANQVFVNGVRFNYLTTNTPSGGLGFGSLLIPSLKAGDSISVRSVSNSINFGDNQLSIFRLSGPATIAASEKIFAKYRIGTPYTPSVNQAINFDSKLYDSHNAVQTGVGTWKFTAPEPGIYSLKLTMYVNSTNPGGAQSFYILVDGVMSDYVVSMLNVGIVSGSSDFFMKAGQTVSVALDGNAQSFGTICTLAIEKL